MIVIISQLFITYLLKQLILMGKSSRRNRPSKAQRKKNAIVARNNNYYNIVLCKSTNKASRGITGGPDRNDANLMKQFKRDKVRDIHSPMKKI